MWNYHPSCLADLLVCSPVDGYRVRDHHGPLHQVLRCPHSFKVTFSSATSLMTDSDYLFYFSNPKLPKNKHIGETLRRPMHTLRRKVSCHSSHNYLLLFLSGGFCTLDTFLFNFSRLARQGQYVGSWVIGGGGPAPPGAAQPVPHQQHGPQPHHVHPEVAKVVAVTAQMSLLSSKVLVLIVFPPTTSGTVV